MASEHFIFEPITTGAAAATAEEAEGGLVAAV